jgi:xanthine dehydrogenase small subunit
MTHPREIAPESLDEALEFLAREGRRTQVEFWRPRSVTPRRLFRSPPEFVLQVSAIPELLTIRLDERNLLSAGAAVSLEKLIASETVSVHLPSFRRAVTGLPQDSPRLTEPLGAHISSPMGVGFMLPTLAVHRSEVVLRSIEGERRVSIEDFTPSSRLTSLRPNELLAAVEIEPMAHTQRAACQRTASGAPSPLLLIGIAALGHLDDEGLMRAVRLAGPGPGAGGARRFTATEELLNGKAPTAAIFRRAARRLCEELSNQGGPSPQGDFEEALLQNLVIKALFELFPTPAVPRNADDRST